MIGSRCRRGWAACLAGLAAAALLAGCGSTLRTAAEPGAAPPAATAQREAHSNAPQTSQTPQGRIVGSHASVLVYLPAPGETLAGIAQRLLGDAGLAWVITQANGDLAHPRPGQPLIVPRTVPAPPGVSADGLQTVPVLCYHRFTDSATARGNKMLMPAANFEAHLQWLARERFRVLRMGELREFLDGRRALPLRSVVITVDDGWASFHRHAFPLLQKYGVPVTLFVYTDIIGTREGLSWAQLREMAQSGLVDIQAHSKTHRNLTQRNAAETDPNWRRTLITELSVPRQLLEDQLGSVGVKVQYLAYPYGDANDAVLQALGTVRYSLAFTVHAGGNAFYAAPQLLRRTMIFGDHTLDDFAARMQTRRPLSPP